MAASQKGHKEIVEMLLGIEKINVNQQQNDGWTALMVASKKLFKCYYK